MDQPGSHGYGLAGLAGIAGAISYSHMRALATAHGDTGWHADAFPLSVDGVEIVASLVLLADRRAGRRSGWLPWAALAIGTAASLAMTSRTCQPVSGPRCSTCLIPKGLVHVVFLTRCTGWPITAS